jgi:GNAT superfamily N-acetyltransferase
METRELKEFELDELLELYAYLHASDNPLPDRTTVKAVWNEIQISPNFHYFGVFVDGRLVSSCTLSIVPNLTRGCRPYGLIENVVTHKDFRRQGFGAAVLKHALDFAWDKNCYKVMLLTGRKSEAVYNFYESVGFDRHAKQAFIAKPAQKDIS